MHRSPFVGLLVVFILVTMMPATTAQSGIFGTGLGLELEVVDGPFDPLASAIILQGRVTLQTDAPTMTPVRILLSVPQSPTWASVRIEPERVEVATTPMEPAASREFQVIITLATNAPAFESSMLRVEAKTEDSSLYRSSHSAAETPIEVDYFGALRVEALQSRFALGRGDMATVPIRVTNLGNALTKVTVSLVGTGGPIAIAVPRPLALTGPASGADTDAQLLHVPVVLEGRLAGPTPITLRFTPAYILNPNEVGMVEEVVILIEPADRSFFSDSSPSPSGPHGEMSVQSAPGSGLGDLPNLRPILPFLCAILGGAAGFAYARRRLQA